MKYRQIITAAFLITLLTTAQPAKVRAGIIYSAVVGMATEPTQIMNNVELLGINIAEWIEIAQQLEQLVHEVEMIEHQLTNLMSLADNPLAMVNTLEQLSDAVQEGQILTYVMANIDQRYAQMYPGYEAYQLQNLTSGVLQQKYRDWSTSNMDSIKAVLKASQIQEETILNEHERLNTIVRLSKNSEGRKQAIQAGNLIAAEEVQSLQRLREIMMANSQLHANYQAKQQDEKDINLAKWEQSIGLETTNTTDGQSMLNINF